MQTSIIAAFKNKVIGATKCACKALSNIISKPEVIVLTFVALIINQIFSPFFRIDIKTLQQFLSVAFIKASLHQVLSL